MISSLFPISKAGVKYLIYTFTAFVVFQVFDLEFLAFVTFVMFFLLMYLFRNPERELPSFAKGSVVAPVDGLLVSVVEIDDADFAYKIEIESNYSNVGVLRVPMNASVISCDLYKGTRLSRNSALSKDTNEYAELNLEDEQGNVLKIVHRLKQSFHDIELDIIKAQKLRQATRYGFAQNSISYVYIPKNFRLNVSVGNELKASETLLGYFS
jgi:phosphatidylserine decarboxylase